MNSTDTDTILSYIQDNLSIITYKTLRKDELEPSVEIKLSHMQHLLTSDAGLFLSRWGKFLPDNLLSLFEPLRDDYEVNFYLKSLRAKRATTATEEAAAARRTEIHNRRLCYLNTQLRNTAYFSDEAMKMREPSLYDYYVGRYVPKNAPFSRDVDWVARVLSGVDNEEYERRLKWERQREEETWEEEEEDTDEEDMDKEKDDRKELDELHMKSDVVNEVVDEGEDEGETIDGEEQEEVHKISAEEMQEMKEEFIRIMEEIFLDGKDRDFDYGLVDNDEAYDDIAQQTADIQDRYFDVDDDNDDVEHEMIDNSNKYTGELDY